MVSGMVPTDELGQQQRERGTTMSTIGTRTGRFTSGAEAGPNLQTIRKYAIDTAARMDGMTPAALIETAKEIETYITGGDIKVTVTTD